MSDPDEEEGMPDEKYSLHSGVSVGDGDTCEDDDDDDDTDNFLNEVDGSVIGNRLSLCATLESGQSGSGTEDDLSGPLRQKQRQP